MQLTSFFSVLVVAAAAGDAIAVPNDGRRSIIEERDDHNLHAPIVNLTHMYKHSVIKRDDGDDVTIWIDNGYIEAEGPEENPEDHLTKRQTARPWMGSRYDSNMNPDACGSHDRKDWTSKNAPTTGGVRAMARWGADNNGAFCWGTTCGGWGWRTIIIAGSNGGANARYRAQAIDGRAPNSYTTIGTRDVKGDADFTISQERAYDGKWRASSYGWESCKRVGGIGTTRMNYEIRRFDEEV